MLRLRPRKFRVWGQTTTAIINSTSGKEKLFYDSSAPKTTAAELLTQFLSSPWRKFSFCLITSDVDKIAEIAGFNYTESFNLIKLGIAVVSLLRLVDSLEQLSHQNCRLKFIQNVAKLSNREQTSIYFAADDEFTTLIHNSSIDSGRRLNISRPSDFQILFSEIWQSFVLTLRRFGFEAACVVEPHRITFSNNRNFLHLSLNRVWCLLTVFLLITSRKFCCHQANKIKKWVSWNVDSWT